MTCHHSLFNLISYFIILLRYFSCKGSFVLSGFSLFSSSGDVLRRESSPYENSFVSLESENPYLVGVSARRRLSSIPKFGVENKPTRSRSDLGGTRSQRSGF